MPSKDSPILNLASEKKMDAVIDLLIEIRANQIAISDVSLYGNKTREDVDKTNGSIGNSADRERDEIVNDLNKKFG